MSEVFVIRGGKPLRGEVEARGSKNAATKMMVASLLTDEPCVIENIPFSADTDITAELLQNVGSNIVWDAPGRRCTIHTREVKNARIPHLSRRNRIPVLALGPLLHRKGVAEVPVLGGCPIGHRPINFHVEALRAMGVSVERRPQSYYAETRSIRGAEISLPYPSVGATENILLTAVRAHGRTIIENAAVEPEVMNLIEMLQGMGAHVVVDCGHRRIEIEGVSKLRGVNARVMPDRSEIVSFAVAALATEGDVTIQNINPSYMQTFLKSVLDVGGFYEVDEGGIRFWGRKPFRPAVVTTSPHPGFMTDWQQPFCVLLTQAAGESIIHETVYDDRFGYTVDVNRMGARIEVSDECWGGDRCRFYGAGHRHSAKIKGPSSLAGAHIAMADIRAGMAHIIAALVVGGESVISGIEHIDRGYEKIDERLRKLGADIRRISN